MPSSYTSTFQIFSPRQIASLRRAGGILRECLQYVARLVRPGISTLELDRAAEQFIRTHGGIPAFLGYQGFTGTLCTSVNDAVVHGIPSKDQLLTEGDIVSLDGGVIVDGLYTDACTTVAVGMIAPDVRQFLDHTSQTLEDVIRDIVRPGVRIGDISSFIQKRLQKSGYEPVRVLTGHGLGDDLHQFPDVPNVGKPNTGPILPVGTMIAIEPIAVMGKPDVFTADDQWTILTKDGSLACHFEHSVLITEEGHELIA